MGGVCKRKGKRGGASLIPTTCENYNSGGLAAQTGSCHLELTLKEVGETKTLVKRLGEQSSEG